jgi:hypothetical protein
MTSPNLQDWFYVELTAKALSDGSSTTFKFSNRPVIDDSSAKFSDYDALLINISGVGVRMGAYLPFSSSGSIILNNAPGSYGFERRFSDILERYTIIDQSVKIYAAQTQYTDYNVTADFSLANTSRVKEWRIDPTSQTLNIQISGTQITPRVMTKIIDSVSFPSAPTSSLGKVLPLVFGEAQEVPAIRIDADADTTPAYAYATTLSTTFPVGGVSAYYTKDHNGKYQEVTSASAVATAVVDGSVVTRLPAGTGAEGITALALSSLEGYVITQFSAFCYGDNTPAGTYSGSVEVGIWTHDDALDAPGVQIGKCIITKADYAAEMQGNAAYNVIGTFDRPVPCIGSTTYYASWAEQYDTADQVRMLLQQTLASFNPYTRDNNDGNAVADTWNTGTGTGKAVIASFYGLKMTDTASSAGSAADGLGYASFEVTQKTAISGFSNPDLTKLDWVVGVEGIQDDSSGTITASPDSLIFRPVHAIELLDQTWSGSAWVAGQFDFVQFDETIGNQVTVHGTTNGRSTAEQVMAAVCKNAGGRITLFNGASKQMAYWEYGTTITSSGTITDEDALVLGVEQRGIETIVNRLTFYYDRRFRDLDFTTGSSQGQFRNYAKTLNWYPSLNYLTDYYSSLSNTLYGIKPLADSAFDFFADTDSAEWMAKFLLANGAFPHWYVSLEIPFFKYRALECLNVIEIIHPDLPAYFGTSANAKLPSYDGTELNPIGGHYWKRAQPYRAQIEAKETIFNAGGTSKLRLDCRLLLNSPKEIT